MYDDLTVAAPSHDPDPADDRAAGDPSGAPRPPGIGEDRSPNASVCPFLRSIDEDDALGLPVESPHPANRCSALGDAVPQSLRQQELVCLTSGHVNCPRYLRGSTDPNELPERVPADRPVTAPIAAALAVFVAAFMISLAFLGSSGGIILTAAAPTASGAIAGAIPAGSPSRSPAVTPAGTSEPTSSPSLTSSPGADPSLTSNPGPSETLTSTPVPSASSTPVPAPAATAKPPPRPTAKPTSNRYALLKPCPDTPNCYLYVIRSGDNLYSIANYFGVPLKIVKASNPWTSSGLKVGRTLRLPPPTR